MNTKHLIRLSAMALLLGLTACSTAPSPDYSNVKLVQAGGTILLNGKPLPNAVVTFDAPDGQFSFGLTDSTGRYKLKYDSIVWGVTPGPKTVRVSTTRKILGLNAEEDEGSESQTEGSELPVSAEVDLVPPRFNHESNLSAEVTPLKLAYDFDLRAGE